MQSYSPLEGRSEYLVQNTHAGHSCPFGPRTMPGGQSPSFSFFGSGLEVSEESGLFSGDLEDRSTGRLLLLWLTLLMAGSGLTGAVGSLLTNLGWKAERRRSVVLCCRCAAAAAATATLCSSRSLCPNDGFRMLSMEKGSADRSGFLFGGGKNGWNSSGGGIPREGGGGGVGSGECRAEFVDGDKLSEIGGGGGNGGGNTKVGKIG